MSGYTKKDAKELISIYRMDIDIAKPNMTQEEIFEEYDRLGLKEGGKLIKKLDDLVKLNPDDYFTKEEQDNIKVKKREIISFFMSLL